MKEVGTTLIRSNSGYAEFTTESVLSSKRILFLEGKIDSSMAMGFVKQFLELTLKDKLSPISIVINSSGGEINAGRLIIDALSGSKVPINVYCFEKAYSMAAVIFISSGGKRLMLPNSSLMIHQPSISEVGGNCSEMKRISKELENYKERIYKLIADHSDFTVEELDNRTVEDLYFNAQEAVEKKIADGVAQFSELCF